MFLPGYIYCEKDAEGESGVLTPESEEPYLIDGVLCLGIVNGKPDRITSYFTSEDVIYLWIEWDNLFEEHEISIYWYNPEGELEYSSEPETIYSPNGRKVVWFSLEPSIPVKTGEWLVEIYLEGSFQRSYLFDIN